MRSIGKHLCSALLLHLLLAVALVPASAWGQQPATTGEPPAAPTATPPAASPPAAESPAPAATPAPETTQPKPSLPPGTLEPVEKLTRSIETAEKQIQQLKELEDELARLRGDVERIIYDSTATADSLRPQLAEVKKQIERLGPPPEKGQPPESPSVAAERQRLNAMAAHLDGAVKTTELAWLRAKQLIDRITVIRYQLFARSLFERRDSPLWPGVWTDVADRMELVVGRIKYYGGDWLRWAGLVGHWLAALAAASAALYIILKVVAGRISRRRLLRPDPPPSFLERVIRASGLAPLQMLPPTAAFLAIYAGLGQLDLLYSPWIGLAAATLSGLLTYTVASALMGVAFQPRHPAWRLIPVSDRTAGRVLFLLRAFIAVYVLDIILQELGRALYVPLSVTVAQSALTSLAFALLLLALFLTPFQPQTGPDRPVNGDTAAPGTVALYTPAWIKLPILATALVILVAAALGYVALARFIAHQVVLTSTALGAAGLVYLAIRAATRGRADGADMVSLTLERRFGLADPFRRRQLSRLIELLLTLFVVALTIPALLVLWGFSGADVRDWAKALFFGFEIGQIRISLARILVGLGLFIALLFLTRVFQRWLRDTVLTQPRVDVGIANSVETAIGYAGIAIALLIALSWAGLDITSLAIVAGALSVGIGFGLQSIVNNFVSGLILLVERPLKVGDWVVIGNEQGNVRRISVRSTEIETFDRASLIVPNSELITGRVLNWTHRNPMGRSVLKIRVAPTADPALVLELLRECTEKHPDLLQSNPAFITFDDFSGVALEFTVRGVVSDVYQSVRVASELRIAILKRLREEGIQLANPQQDVHLRDLEWVRTAAGRLVNQRNEQRTSGAPPEGSNDNG